MKKLMGIFTILLFTFPAIAPAQGIDDSDRINKIVDLMITEERKITTEFIALSEQEAQAFWPIYDDYQRTLRKFLRKIAALTFRYIHDYKTLSDEQADAIVGEIIDMEIEKLIIIKNYTGQFRSVLSPKKMLLFLQTVPAIEIGFALKIMSETPLVK